MKCVQNIFFMLLFCLSLLPLYSQDVNHNSQLLLIPGILNDCDMSLNHLEANMNASNRIINNLQKTVNSMQTTINIQQRQLQQASENLVKSEQIAQQKLQKSEVTLQSLKTSWITSLREKNEYKLKFETEKSKNKELIKAVRIMGGILTVIIALIITFIIIKIKTTGLPSIILKVFNFLIKKLKG